MTGSKPEVLVTSPAGGASLTSPVTIEASAFPTPGHSITGWWIYVDSVATYSAGALSWIAPKVTMKTGTHTVVIRAWDTGGGFGDQTFNVTVAALKPTVSVLTPLNNASVGSPMNIQATASPTAGQKVSSWSVLVDSKTVYTAGAVSSINTKLSLAAGKHTVIVRAWDTSKAYGDKTLTLTSSSKPAVTVSAPAIAASVTSPIRLTASATPSAGHSINKWWVYVDGVGKYQAELLPRLVPALQLPRVCTRWLCAPGTHPMPMATRLSQLM
jgi:hypothetical protein